MHSTVIKTSANWCPDPARQFVRSRVNIADDLIRRYRGPTILADLDAQALLCVVLGALASRLWPKAPDSKRFVELLAVYSRAQPSVRTVSLPALINKFPNDDRLKALDPSISDSQVLSSGEVDRTDMAIKQMCPQLSLMEIRRASYASFIYKYIKCGLLHEYSIEGALSYYGCGDDTLHYINRKRINEEDGRRLLFVPYSYLRAVVITTASSVCSEWENCSRRDFKKKQPGSWWIDA